MNLLLAFTTLLEKSRDNHELASNKLVAKSIIVIIIIIIIIIIIA